MYRIRWQRLLLCLTVVAFLAGMLKEMGMVQVPQVPALPGLSAIYSRLQQAGTNVDFEVVLKNARGLGSFTYRLDWGEVLKAIMPGQRTINPLHSRTE